MNPYQHGAANWQYGYTLGPGSEATGGAYAAYYAGSAAASSYSVQPATQSTYRAPPQHRTITTIHPTTAAPSAAAQTAKPATSWQQIKQEAVLNQPKPYYPTKVFVKASDTPQEAQGATSGTVEDATVCMKLHEVAIQNKIVETYEKIGTEIAPGIHGVRLKFGTETYTGTGSNLKLAKQNAAATALAQTKYPKPLEKKTMKLRPHGITATQELHELATKKGTEVKFRFLEPPNFEFKAAMRLWSKEEMRGNYRVQLLANGLEFYGQADLPQQAKHNAAIQALAMLNRLPDASKISTVIQPSSAGPATDQASQPESVKNVIMILNEIAMAQNQCMEWSMVKEDGPPHARKFTWSLQMGPHEAMGVGCSKKVAKSLAAQSMYQKIPDEWKSPGNTAATSNSKVKKRKPKPKKRKAEESSQDQSPKKPKEGEPAADGPPRPAYSVIHATNPISALYEYCRKSKLSIIELKNFTTLNNFGKITDKICHDNYFLPGR